METGRPSRAAFVKAALLLMFIVAAVLIVRLTGVNELLTLEKLGALLDAVGMWAPLVFILVYAVEVCLFIPGTLLTSPGTPTWTSPLPPAKAVSEGGRAGHQPGLAALADD